MERIHEPESQSPEDFGLSSEIDEILLSAKDPDSQESEGAQEFQPEPSESVESLVTSVKRVLPRDLRADLPPIDAASKKLRLSSDGLKDLIASYRLWRRQLSVIFDSIEESDKSPVVSDTVEAIKQGSRQLTIGLSTLYAKTLKSDAQLQYQEASAGPGENSTNNSPEFSWSTSVVEQEKINATPEGHHTYWSYKFYRNKDNQTPTVRTCVTKADADKELATFLKEDVVGFDMEWVSNIAAHGVKKNISLIQVASEMRIVLIQIARFQGETPSDLLPQNLARLLEDQRIVKTGVNIAGDCTRLEKHFGIISSGIFELTNFHRLVSYFQNPEDVFSTVHSKRLVSFGYQIQEHFGIPLFKGDVRTSRWDEVLSDEQVEYAASDAYAGLQLFRLLDKKRQGFNPMPPLPMFNEAQTQPKIILIGANQTVDQFCVDYKIGPHNSLPPTDDDTLSRHKSTAQLDSNSNVPPNPNDPAAAPTEAINVQTARPPSNSDPSTPALASTSASTSTPTTATSASLPKHSLDPPHPLLVEAELWAKGELEKLDSACLQEPTRVRPSYLKAYYLWHVRQLDVGAITALWPVKAATIAGYLDRAVVWGKLPCDKERFEAVREMVLPKYRTGAEG